MATGKSPFEWAMESYLRMMALVMSLQVMMALLQQFYVYSPAFMQPLVGAFGGFAPFMGNIMYLFMYMPMLMMMQLLPYLFRGFYYW